MLLLKRGNNKIIKNLIITLAIIAINIPVISLVHAKESEKSLSNDTIKDSIVKIYTVVNKTDYFRPWNVYTVRIGGSGCVIAGNRILTNAHVVADQTFVEVRRRGEAKRHRAKVLSVSHDADLALLTVENEDFFNNVTALEFGELPEMQDDVFVYGFPKGGDMLSVTKGVLSRIEHRQYAHSSEYLLAAQIDAAINPGNSGGPVIAKGKVVGVVMQAYQNAENIGYMVPIPIIEHFLYDIEDGNYDGFPRAGIKIQPMENPGMRRKHKMHKNQTGVLVINILPESTAEGKIQKEDIILQVGGHDIADDGTVEFRPKERTSLSYFFDKHQVGEEINLTLSRDSKIIKTTITLDKTAKDFQLVQMEQYDTLPRYFIYGGIVFSPLTKNLIKQWGKNWTKNAPKHLVVELDNWPTPSKSEIVVALQVLGADINEGYHDISNWIVEEVNNQKFKDFDEFYNLIVNSQDEFITFKDNKGKLIVIEKAPAEESQENILKTYRIKADRSQDLM